MAFQNKPNVAQYFVICFIFMLSLNLSSNASAVTLITEVTPTGKVWNSPNVNCRYIDNSYINKNDNTCDLTSDQINVNNLSSISTRSQIAMKKDHYYTALISVKSPYADGLPYLLWNTYTSNSEFNLIEVKEITNDAAQENVYYILDSECTRTSYLQGNWWCEKSNDVIYIKFYEITLRFKKNDGNYNWWLGTTGRELFYSGGSSYINSVPFATLYQITEYKSSNTAQDEVAEKELESTTNIENQTSQNTTGGTSENQQTTNLIGVFSGFLTELQTFSATDCNLDLPFPSFIGGTQTVNICQGKDVLGNFITVVGTLAMVTFYIPLCLVLLKMIYNEIRSFTNG